MHVPGGDQGVLADGREDAVWRLELSGQAVVVRRHEHGAAAPTPLPRGIGEQGDVAPAGGHRPQACGLAKIRAKACAVYGVLYDPLSTGKDTV